MSGVVANRYAGALFEVAREHENIDAVEEQIRFVNQVVTDNEALRQVSRNPQVDQSSKKAVFEKIFKRDLSNEVMNFLKVLVDHRRESLLQDIQDEYTDIANNYRGIVDVDVTTAKPLSEADETKIADTFGRLYNKKLRIQAKVDPDVIGGILVKVGNQLYDGTIAGKLTRFNQELKAGR